MPMSWPGETSRPIAICSGRYAEHRAILLGLGRGKAFAPFPACLRRIQIAEWNEAQHEQAGESCMITRREVKCSGLNRTESGNFWRRQSAALTCRPSPLARVAGRSKPPSAVATVNLYICAGAAWRRFSCDIAGMVASMAEGELAGTE